MKTILVEVRHRDATWHVIRVFPATTFGRQDAYSERLRQADEHGWLSTRWRYSP